jgi:hypothetical protein
MSAGASPRLATHTIEYGYVDMNDTEEAKLGGTRSMPCVSLDNRAIVGDLRAANAHRPVSQA